MVRMKPTARKSTGGKVPKKWLGGEAPKKRRGNSKAARKSSKLGPKRQSRRLHYLDLGPGAGAYSSNPTLGAVPSSFLIAVTSDDQDKDTRFKQIITLRKSEKLSLSAIKKKNAEKQGDSEVTIGSNPAQHAAHIPSTICDSSVVPKDDMDTRFEPVLITEKSEKASPVPKSVVKHGLSLTTLPNEAQGKELTGQESSEEGKGKGAKSAEVGEFYDKASESQWKKVLQRKIQPERYIDYDSPKASGVYEILKKHKILGSTVLVKPYCKELVQEFYSNMKISITSDTSLHHEKVWIRGNWIPFTPSIIKSVLNLPTYTLEEQKNLDSEVDMNKLVYELTEGKVLVWSESRRIDGDELTLKYAALHKIAMYNWLPGLRMSKLSKDMCVLLYLIGTGEKVELGKIMYDQIVKNAEKDIRHAVLPFPSLISQCIWLGKVDLQPPDDQLESVQKLKVLNKILSGSHVYTSQELSSSKEEVERKVATSEQQNTLTKPQMIEFLAGEIVQIRKKLVEIAQTRSNLKKEAAVLLDKQRKLQSVYDALVSFAPDEGAQAPPSDAEDDADG